MSKKLIKALQARRWSIRRTKPEGTFCWNTYERMALESGGGEEVTRFWDQHFPFMLSVHSDYDYVAICLAKKGFGRVVHGSAPEWESPSCVAGSFADFISDYSTAASATPSSRRERRSS